MGMMETTILGYIGFRVFGLGCSILVNWSTHGLGGPSLRGFLAKNMNRSIVARMRGVLFLQPPLSMKASPKKCLLSC